jgi:hypothetical protein
VVETYSSKVKDQTVYYLPKYTLAPGTYLISVTVARSDVSSSSSVSRSVSVTILSSGLTASIYGGDVQSVRVGQSISLDASRSVDNDIQDSTQASTGLSYSWHCNETLPSLGGACTVNYVSGSKVAVYFAPVGSESTRNVITLLVQKGARSANTSLALQVVAADAAVVVITGSSVATGSKFVTTNKFTVSGLVSSELACVAGWSVSTSVGTVDLSTTGGYVLSALTSSIAAGASGTSVSLVLAANALPQSATLQFALTCGNSVSSVTVVTNGSPQGGSVSVSPSSGTALETNFALTAPSWVDDDTPLTYQFLISSAGGSWLEVRRPLQVDNGVLNLPAGTGVGNSLTIMVRVYDLYGAWSSATFNVTVAPIAASALTSVLSSQLSVDASTDVDGAKVAVTLVTASLNSAVCDSGCSTDEVTARQSIRASLLDTLYSVSTVDVIDVTSLSSMTASLAAITQITSEISESGVTSTLKVAQSLLSVANASSVTLSESSITSLLQSLSSVTVAGSSLSMVSGSTFSVVESTSVMISLVASCNDVMLSGMAYGESAMLSVYDSFSTVLSSQIVENGNVSATVTSASNLASSVSIPVSGTASVKMSMVSTQSWAYGNNSAMVSEVLSMTVSVTTGSLTSGSRVVFVIQKSEEIPNVVIPSKYNFTEQCRYGEFKSIFHVCPDTGTNVTMECTGGQEVLTAVCPGQVKETVCGSAIGDSSLSCDVIESSAASVTCSCILPSTSRRRQLTSSQAAANSALEQTGVSHVAALTAYVGENFAGTLAGAADLNSPAAFRKVLIVIVAFIVLWTGGFAIIMSAAFRKKVHSGTHKRQKTSVERLKHFAQAAHSPVAIGEYLRNYVDEVFPSAFKDKPSLECLFDEIYKHHRYVLILSCSDDKKSDQNRIVTGVRLLTVQTMLMFLLAVFYELQAPSDDGSCKTYATEQSCLARKSIIEAHSTYCQWSENALREMTCSYREPSFTYLTIAYVSVVISMVTALVSSPIDRFFDMLTAPTADSVKLNAVESFSARVFKKARRVSVSAVNTMSDVVKRSKAAVEKRWGQVNFQTREVPESTRVAHALAVAAAPALQAKARDLMLRRLSSGVSFKDKYAVNNTFPTGDDSDNDADDKDDEEESESSSDDDNGAANNAAKEEDDDREQDDQQSEVSGDQDASPSNMLSSIFGNRDKTVVKKFTRLAEEIDFQRRALRVSEVEEFDGSWGIDPTGEFVKRDSLSLMGYHRIDAAANIKNEIREVTVEADKIANELRNATDQHIGLEILHLFVLDILGRHTAPARIFQSKAEEDFFKVRVISRRGQMLAWCGVVFLNLFFMYFTILKSYQKGNAWQRAFVAGSVVQIVVEILFNETVECVWVNFLVPRLVSEEVHSVATKLHSAIEQLCSPETVDAHYFLDAPGYLFVSTAVAKKFPNLLESMVVRAYQSHLPGMLANKWQFGPVARINRSGILRGASVVATITVGLQVAAASPFIFQRMMIRTAQPWLLTGIVVAFAYLMKKPIILAFVCLFIVLLLCLVIYRSFFRKPAPVRKVSLDEQRTDSDVADEEVNGPVSNSGAGSRSGESKADTDSGRGRQNRNDGRSRSSSSHSSLGSSSVPLSIRLTLQDSTRNDILDDDSHSGESKSSVAGDRVVGRIQLAPDDGSVSSVPSDLSQVVKKRSLPVDQDDVILNESKDTASEGPRADEKLAGGTSTMVDSRLSELDTDRAADGKQRSTGTLSSKSHGSHAKHPVSKGRTRNLAFERKNVVQASSSDARSSSLALSSSNSVSSSIELSSETDSAVEWSSGATSESGVEN